MTTTHTPGPWTATRSQKQGYGWYGWTISHTEPRSNQPPQPHEWEREICRLDTDDEMTQANAHLIAAAPELLAALEAVMACNKELGAISRPIGNEARAAIAKAKGQNQ